MSDRMSKFIQSEIDRINVHLPAKVITLRNALQMEKPGVTLRDGTFQAFEEEELEYIKEKIPKTYWGHVLLPILITRRRDMGGSEFIVGGSEQNLYLVKSTILDLPRFDIWRIEDDKKYLIYRYQIKGIRKKLPTTSVIAFS